MEIGQQLLVTARNEWRDWLEQNHTGASEIWLIRFKKHTGKPALPYEDAVEEALCFGWIDGILKRLDSEKYVIRFSPRRENSAWSELNRKRVGRMIRQQKMRPAGMRSVREAKKNGRWHINSPREIPFEVPTDLAHALAADERAKANFELLAPSYKKLFIRWIVSAKREETRKRRIAKAVKMTSRNEKPGML
ncbi:MAG: YdeI/OmpD-associated family protein [Candidatus Delongbacteria bacterium]|nr:YdeI/OmpD-associated family protein [Candidatus Delongbacteria bacterium]